MSRFIVVMTATLALTGPAAAHRFEARMAVAPREAAPVSSGMGWTCAGAVCAAEGPMSDAPVRICGQIARALGRVEGFTVDAQPLDGDWLAKCNARAAASAR